MKRLTDIKQILNNLKLIYLHPRNISIKFEKDGSLTTGDITDNPISVRKGGNEQTDRHKIDLKLFRTSVETSKKYLQKIEDISHPELIISKDNQISVRN